MMAIEIFKILHKQSPAYLNDIVSFKHISYSFRRQQTVTIPQVRTTNFVLHSLRYAGATLWNELPDAIRAQTNLNWNGNSCRCGSCISQFFMLHFMLRAFRFLLAFSLALFIFIFALYVLISVHFSQFFSAQMLHAILLSLCICMCILLMLQLLSYVICHALCIYMFLNVCVVTVFLCRQKALQSLCL